MTFRITGLVMVAGLAVLVTGCGDGPADPFGADDGLVTFFSDVAAGGHHTCGVTRGRLYCWGSNEFGQASGELGEAGGATPRQVQLPELALEVTAGQRHTCGLLVGGKAFCWGWNHLGQIGHGSVGGVRAPGQVNGEYYFSAIDAGWNHTCGIAGSRTLCWGVGGQGQLGDGQRVDRPSPVEVAGGTAFVQVTAGGHHTCGRTAQGTAFCWGLNQMGQLGTGSTESSAVPVPVAGGDRFARLAAGFEHTCGVLMDGGVKCWGSNVHGELGNSEFEPAGLPGSTVPTAIVRIDGLVRVDAGAHFTCGSLRNGDTWCWGRGTDGQLAAGQPVDHAVPQVISAVAGPGSRRGGIHNMAKLALGSRHACGMTTAGAIFCWGTGPSGELGHSQITFTIVPIRVDGR